LDRHNYQTLPLSVSIIPGTSCEARFASAHRRRLTRVR